MGGVQDGNEGQVEEGEFTDDGREECAEGVEDDDFGHLRRCSSHEGVTVNLTVDWISGTAGERGERSGGATRLT